MLKKISEKIVKHLEKKASCDCEPAPSNESKKDAKKTCCDDQSCC